MKLLITINLFLSIVEFCNAYPNLESNLHTDLMVNYSRHVRPVLDFSHSVNLTFGASLYQLKNFDAKEETMSLILWQRLTWTDEYLRWDPAKYGGIGVTRFDVSGIWVPDLMPYNDVGEYNIMHYAQIIPVSVESNGRVLWLSQTSTTTTCTMDVSHFPFDSQTCFVAIGSWQYKQPEVDIECASNTFDLTSYVEHSQWDLIKTSCNKNVTLYPTGFYSFLNFTLKFQRLSNFYLRNIVLPNTSLLILSTLVFFIPFEIGERIGYGVTIMLALCVNLIIVTEYLPETSKTIPIVCHYFFLSILLSSLSLLLSVIMVNVHSRKRIEKTTAFRIQLLELNFHLRKILGALTKPSKPASNGSKDVVLYDADLLSLYKSEVRVSISRKPNALWEKIALNATFIDNILGITYLFIVISATISFLYFSCTGRA